jgi:ABC-type enterochelin transport system permease subunit
MWIFASLTLFKACDIIGAMHSWHKARDSLLKFSAFEFRYISLPLILIVAHVYLTSDVNIQPIVDQTIGQKNLLCSPETFDFIYPSMRHGKEE